jgi:hypothetical protein
MTGYDLAAMAAAIDQQLAMDVPADTKPAGRRATRRPAMDLAGMAAVIDEQLALLNDTGDGAARGWVSVGDVAWGTYGTAAGVDLVRRHTAATGYIVYSHPLRGGPGGNGPDMTAVYVAHHPDSDHTAATVIYTGPGATFTVLDPPPGWPDGEPAPWTRMLVEDQITTVGDLIGRPVTIHCGPSNPLYQIGDDEPTALSRAADYLLAGGYLHSVGRSRPIPHPNRLAEALTRAPQHASGGTL